ncbi:hypothetical protein IMSHALPRED_002536 [Imshaugia aleurites]|uniref:Uncharacterized protein n=1 Tax=Imshaugia aleurites TaxID=172621 RepID=A0A8H3J6F3_9LECA|nr:hypothetical protein IMSHALPRED_002536 [Imshaugia aleurites]
MDPKSYQASAAGQAGPDSSYRFGSTPAKYAEHLAKIAPIGRSGDATYMVASPLDSATSPYDSPYTTAARQAASPSVGTSVRATGPPLTTTGPAASPSNEPKTRPVIPALSAGSDSIPSLPSISTPRSPSPDAEKLISSLTNYESLSDDALYEAALNAQQAMVKWQNEYIALEAKIEFMRDSPKNSRKKRKNPRELEDPREYDQKHHNSLHKPPPNISQRTGKHPQTTARPLFTHPITNQTSSARKPRNELHIDMNAPMQPLEGKRVRTPRILDHDDFAFPNPKKPTKRAREPDNTTTTTTTTNDPAPDQPPAKKQALRPRSITPPAWIRTARDVKSESKELPAAPENALVLEKAVCPAKKVIKRELGEVARGKDPVRAAAARLVWARRRAGGTNGRCGGLLKGRGRKGVRVKVEVEEEGV